MNERNYLLSRSEACSLANELRNQHLYKVVPWADTSLEWLELFWAIVDILNFLDSLLSYRNTTAFFINRSWLDKVRWIRAERARLLEW